MRCPAYPPAATKKLKSSRTRNASGTPKIFGLMSVDKDNVALTALGRDINDPHTEIAAPARAFVSVPLYLKIFNPY